MNRRIWSARRLAPFAVLSLAAGTAVAHAAGAGAPADTPPVRAPTTPTVATGVPLPATVVPVPGGVPVPANVMSVPGALPVPGTVALEPPAPAAVYAQVAPSGPLGGAPLYLTRAPVPLTPCRPRGRGTGSASRKPPSEALLKAFAILRRDRNDDDALPARALAALKARGLAPVDPQSARLLRADRTARVWVVPVPDIDASTPFTCVPAGARTRTREGLAVVAVGEAPGGGGGALSDLQRGLAPATVDPCAGARDKMLGVSGIVPDGVGAVFVTAADGTATRADVRNNGYAFVLPGSNRPEQRYVVWTGPDGSPHVQPLPVVVLATFGAAARDKRLRACAALSGGPHVTPDPVASSCGSLNPFLSHIDIHRRLRARQRALAAARRASRSAPRDAAPGCSGPADGDVPAASRGDGSASTTGDRVPRRAAAGDAVRALHGRGDDLVRPAGRCGTAAARAATNAAGPDGARAGRTATPSPAAATYPMICSGSRPGLLRPWAARAAASRRSPLRATV